MVCASLMPLAMASGSPLPDRTIRPASATLNRLSPTMKPDITSTPRRLAVSPPARFSTARSNSQPATAPTTTGAVAALGR